VLNDFIKSAAYRGLKKNASGLHSQKTWVTFQILYFKQKEVFHFSMLPKNVLLLNNFFSKFKLLFSHLVLWNPLFLCSSLSPTCPVDVKASEDWLPAQTLRINIPCKASITLGLYTLLVSPWPSLPTKNKYSQVKQVTCFKESLLLCISTKVDKAR
jgi:hypothetical protein